MPRGRMQHNKDLIDACHTILATIHPASVRAVCYQLFTRGLLESMAKTCTNRVSNQLVYGREQGMIPWDWGTPGLINLAYPTTRGAATQPTAII